MDGNFMENSTRSTYEVDKGPTKKSSQEGTHVT
jgi:hypothetical protein